MTQSCNRAGFIQITEGSWQTEPVGIFGITTSARIQYLRVAKTGSAITGVGRVTKKLGRLRKCEATLYLPDGKAAATASAVFFLPTVSEFRRLAKVPDVPTEFHKRFYRGQKG